MELCANGSLLQNLLSSEVKYKENGDVVIEGKNFVTFAWEIAKVNECLQETVWCWVMSANPLFLLISLNATRIGTHSGIVFKTTTSLTVHLGSSSLSSVAFNRIFGSISTLIFMLKIEANIGIARIIKSGCNSTAR